MSPAVSPAEVVNTPVVFSANAVRLVVDAATVRERHREGLVVPTGRDPKPGRRARESSATVPHR